MKSESAAGRSSGNDDALRAEEDVMTVQELIDKQIFGVVNLGDSLDRQITVPFCCDLLSIAMGRAPAGCAWVTVMANMNTLAVAVLTEVACIVLAEGMKLDDTCLQKAVQQGITVFQTAEPVFDAALKVQRLLDA